jgi:transmembrane sensor
MQDQYASYSSTLLAGEESFIRWVQFGENDEQWNAWILRHRDRDLVVEEARKIVSAFIAAGDIDLPEAGKKELWNRIYTSAKAENTKTSGSNLRQLWIWGLSAAAAFALMVWINGLLSSEKVLAQAGEQKEIILPEESMVTLNAGSSIAFREDKFKQDRVVHLEGEAFFKVKPGSTFKVETDFGTITVLGTSFNIFSRQGRFEVSCYTGKVKVECGAKDQLTLTTGEQSIKNEPGEMMSLDRFILTSESPEWTAGRFNFEDQPLHEVVAELERQYAIHVNLDSKLKELRYTGLFESGDLDKALSLITWPLHLKASVDGKTVTISR